MLKKGDLIICDGSKRADGLVSWWVMQRDEKDDDRWHNHLNADLVSRPTLREFEDTLATSWDSDTAINQGAKVIPADEWTDEHYAQIAKWALLGD